MATVPKITVVDYGSGNLFSVCRGLEKCGGSVHLSGDPAVLRDSERIALPGVGAFENCMIGLSSRGLVDAILDFARRERPLLGICVGMQVLVDESEEFGLHPGLGLIPGRVTAIPSSTPGGEPLKVPHIGWTPLDLCAGAAAHPVFSGISPGQSTYFVHSFAVETRDAGDTLSLAEYGGRKFAAVIGRGSWIGCQFHPERSGPVGLKLLENFLKDTK